MKRKYARNKPNKFGASEDVLAAVRGRCRAYAQGDPKKWRRENPEEVALAQQYDRLRIPLKGRKSSSFDFVTPEMTAACRECARSVDKAVWLRENPDKAELVRIYRRRRKPRRARSNKYGVSPEVKAAYLAYKHAPDKAVWRRDNPEQAELVRVYSKLKHSKRDALRSLARRPRKTVEELRIADVRKAEADRARAKGVPFNLSLAWLRSLLPLTVCAISVAAREMYGEQVDILYFAPNSKYNTPTFRHPFSASFDKKDPRFFEDGNGHFVLSWHNTRKGRSSLQSYLVDYLWQVDELKQQYPNEYAKSVRGFDS